MNKTIHIQRINREKKKSWFVPQRWELVNRKRNKQQQQKKVRCNKCMGHRKQGITENQYFVCVNDVTSLLGQRNDRTKCNTRHV